MNQRHLMCVNGLSIILHPHNSCCYCCVALTKPCVCPVFMSALEVMPRFHGSGPTQHSYRLFYQEYAANHTPLVMDMKIIKSFFKLKFLHLREF